MIENFLAQFDTLAYSSRPNIRCIPSEIMITKNPLVFSGYSFCLLSSTAMHQKEIELNEQKEGTD